jgi:hypothetical protein
MELDETRVSCLKVAPRVSQSFPLKSDRFILEAIFERGYNVRRKTYLEKIQLTNLFVVPLSFFLPPRSHLLNKGHRSRSVQSTAQSLLTSPLIGGRDKFRCFYWIGVKSLNSSKNKRHYSAIFLLSFVRILILRSACSDRAIEYNQKLLAARDLENSCRPRRVDASPHHQAKN